MLENALLAAPEELWSDRSQQPEFWYLVYHTLFWLDFSCPARKRVRSPAPLHSTTTRMADNLGFEVVVVEDATATFERTGPDGVRYSADKCTIQHWRACTASSLK
jgi:hypothetical protein